MHTSPQPPQNRSGLSLTRHWLLFFNLCIGLYVTLPILAPVFMHLGLTRPARLIYTVYSPMCHQMAFRSFFLYGEQTAYPRQQAHAAGLTPFEAYSQDLTEFSGIQADDWPSFFLTARRFLGNDEMGYKMALCERDISIFGALLAGGLVYAVLRRRRPLQPLPLLWFVVLGMLPIGVGGFSQLFGYYGLSVPAMGRIFPLRESPPLLRSLTGAWFGLCVAWLALPNIELSLRDLKPPKPPSG